MRRSERERIARRNAYIASRQKQSVGFWSPPKGFSVAEYFKAVGSHPPIEQMLDYLSGELQEKKYADFIFNESKDGVCEKCKIRKMNLPEESILKSGDNCFAGVDAQFSKFVADQFASGKKPVVLTPNLHREFVYQSWIEKDHLDHIRDYENEPGLAAILAHPEFENGTMAMSLGFRAVDGSHRAALTYQTGRPFSVYFLSPVEILQSIFSIDNKKNPFFVAGYTEEAEELLRQMALGTINRFGEPTSRHQES